MQPLKNDSPMIISHLTDVEGNLSYLERWSKRSPHIQFVDGRLLFRDLKSNCKFIYGGDCCDKGPGDLRIGRALADFKMHNPAKVTLIAGNREIKCRRFTYELHSHIHQRLLYGDAAWWNQKVPPRDYVILQMQAEGKPTTSEALLKRYVLSQSTEACQTLYLKWMLHETMGCGSFYNKPSTYEYRRMELAALASLAPEEISDDLVTRSFIDSVMPSGFLTSYLKQAELGKIIGETLFIHGAITLENMGFVPGMSESDVRMNDAREWIELLNTWYVCQIRDWLETPVEEGLHSPGHKPLDQYVIFNPKSIVTSNWYRQGKFVPIPEKVVQFLNDAGIYRVVSGHQPFSDFPLIIRNPDLEVIVGDTGYSDPSADNDNRGQALHNLTIIDKAKGGSIASIEAIRRDGRSMTLNLPSHDEVRWGKDTRIGHFTSDGRLIRPVSASLSCSSQLDGYQVIDEPLKD